MSVPTRVRRLTAGAARAAAATVLATAMLLTVAGSAQASFDVSSTMVSDPDHVDVEGIALPTPATGATHATVALCNIGGAVTAADLGERCDRPNSVGFTDIDDFMSPGVELDVVADFDDWNFETNMSAGTTTACATTEGEDDCGIVVAYYSAPNYPAPPFNFLHAEAEEITFE